ncbi:Autonomous transposable element EN-1 mosaic protein, partial [Bienertia sinuspersici]
MHTSQPTLPRSNRQYVPPLMLAMGRGKKLRELHTSTTKVSAKSNIGTESYLGVKSTSLAKRSHSHLYKKGHSSVLRNENRASFNPLYDVGAGYKNFGSPEESLHDGVIALFILHPKMRIWILMKDVFSNENMESYREHVLDHMKELWINWRSDLLRCLIKEVYSTDEFKKASARNSTNRLYYQKELAHQTGSKPLRQGANNGIKPDLVNVFYTTRKKDNSIPNAETTQKYDEIREILEKDPSLPHVE